MPKVLFYAGTAFCLFVALTCGAEWMRELNGEPVSFAALHLPAIPGARAAWAIVVALVAGLAAAAIFLRMASLLAARNLFAALLAVLCVAGSVVTLSALLLVQSRILVLFRAASANPALPALEQIHLAAYLLLGYFVSLSLLALRPYFRIQASRTLAVLVFVPLPLFAMVLMQELLDSSSLPLPSRSPASLLFFATLAVLFFAIAVHCIRHRYLFLEMTNLRELLDSRIDPTRNGRPVRVAFDS